MRAPSEVKPFILHPETVVRNYAVEYFQESYSKDPELMPSVLQVCEKDPDAEDIRLMLSYAENFTQTPETLTKVFQLYQASQFNRPWYAQIILHSDPGLLCKFPEELASLSGPMQIKIVALIEMSLRSTPDLLQELIDYGTQNAGRYVNEFDFQYGVFMARELARRSDFSKEWALDLLQAGYPDDYDGYLDIYATILAGEMRLEEAIPALLDNIRKEGDVLSEEAEAALTKIGSETVIRQIRDCFLEESWCFRLYTSNTFGNVKLDACEEILLELLRQETDLSIITILASSLCKLFSEQGIPAVRNLIYEGYDRSSLNLVEDLYCNCIINGVELPEMQQWREELAKESERFAEMLEEHLMNQALTDDEAEEDEDDFEDWDDEDEDDDDWDEDDEEQPRFEVKQLVSNKVGRNEPCPCGSGKKYKKCCLGKKEKIESES